MEGPDTEALARACEAAGDAPVIYSGGIGSLEDLRGARRAAGPRLEGVIVGKALYERRFSVTEARLALGEAAA